MLVRIGKYIGFYVSTVGPTWYLPRMVAGLRGSETWVGRDVSYDTAVTVTAVGLIHRERAYCRFSLLLHAGL